ncbi:Tetratricopeptide repeat-containing protein [Dendrosporobacter quercicolus]|uniref:Tetratricopeptide repeat-containing protein n=1 Tax=Dendrosporobacter quercicolus TaxID=146817 RepID=A0A1G9UPD7_9FIRM|nr:Tetratricopeptide repeat-containing protein [Dendrosporobacter quercicolus]
MAFNYQERAYSHIKLKNAEAALADTNQAIALDPNKAIFYAGRGNAFALMEKYPEAIKDFEKCLELQGKPLDSQFNLGQVYELTGNQEKALFYYSIIAKIPNLPEPVNVKVQARMMGDWENYKEWI